MSLPARPNLRLIALALLLAAGPGFAQSAGSAGAEVKPATPTTAEVVPAPGVPPLKAKPVRNPVFYSAEVNVTSQNAAERRGATIRALGLVIVRLTGDQQAAANPVIRRASSNVEALTTSSEIRQDSDTVNGVPVYKSTLVVSFDPESVDALISGAGLKYWSNERPKPILWLAIDDGRGARLVTGKQTAVVRPLATRGLERGMRFLLPAGTSVEQAAVTSIWSLNAPAMQVLTDRYRNDLQLIGKVYRQPPGWAADWVMTQAGVELARWSFADANPRRVIASGVDEGSNALARRDAVFLDTGVAGVYSIDVVGVDTQGDFLRLMSYLQTLAIVRRVTALEATPQTLRLQLDLSIGMKGFRTMVATGGTLAPLSEPETVGADSGRVPQFGLQ